LSFDKQNIHGTFQGEHKENIIKLYQEYGINNDIEFDNKWNLVGFTNLVYDLETENHHFSAGIGNIVVHNTDSLFIKVRREQVDDFIRKIDPNVVQTQRPNNPRIIETVYTRLRNEMSHTRPKADILNTKNEINQNVSGFANIVKKAIQPLNK